MNKIDELVSKINPKRKSPSKNELWDFVNESLSQVGEINELYKKYFEKPQEQGATALFEDIENKFEKIKQAYLNLFNKEEDGKTKIEIIEEKIKDIKKYHEELLEGDNSIEANIEVSNQKILEFYEDLFGKSEEDGGIEREINQAVEKILKSEKHILSFETNLNQKIKPFIKEVQGDIVVKRKEINKLLSNVTGSTLAEAYAESKHEYSIPTSKQKREGRWFNSIDILLFNFLGRYIGFIFNYILFIFPLISVSLIFINENVAQMIIKSLSQKDVVPSVIELIYIKTAISIPLIWIAWYGQRNISQRKRLAEEYNHKMRVVQMYLMFIANETSYKLKDKIKLEEALLDVIARNPSEVFGHDETMFDKISEIFKIKKLDIKEIAKEVKDVLEKTT